MSPEPHDSSSPAVSVLGLHQSVLRATNSAFGVLGWLASRTHSVLPFPLWQASSVEQLQLNQEYVCIEVRLLSGADIQLRIVSPRFHIFQCTLGGACWVTRLQAHKVLQYCSSWHAHIPAEQELAAKLYIRCLVALHSATSAHMESISHLSAAAGIRNASSHARGCPTQRPFTILVPQLEHHKAYVACRSAINS